RQINLPHTQSFLRSSSMNTMDYESTGYQNNSSVSYTHPGNLSPPPYCNQAETHTNNFYSLPIPFCGSSTQPTDNRHFNNRSISYTITPISMQTSLSFNSSNAMNEPR
ncbi:221_t:CDS:1, partial [Paraglomus occultum]